MCAMRAWLKDPIVTGRAQGQAPVCIIARAKKVEPICREGGGGLPSVSSGNHLLHPLGGVVPQAHLDQAAHDVSDHVVQEGIGLEIKTVIGMRGAAALGGDVQMLQGLDRRQGLTLRGSKGGEIMGAQQAKGSLLHAMGIEWFGHPAHTLVLNTWAHGALEQQIAVAP